MVFQMQIYFSEGKNELSLVFIDPVNKLRGLGIDTGVAIQSTSTAPGDNTTVSVIGGIVVVTETDMGATRVTLARIKALLSRADHVIGDGARAIVLITL